MSEQAFPPEDPGSFLSLCDGEWMSLRSCFELAAGGDDEWHSSERGELTVRCVSEQGALGQLKVQAPGRTSSTLTFAADGQLILDGDSPGNWRFWPDGSMELNLSRADGVQVQERIWFTRVPTCACAAPRRWMPREHRCRAVSARTSAGCPNPRPEAAWPPTALMW